MENPSNIIPDQLIVLDGDAGLVPKASSQDVGKVLGVLNSSGDVGWVPDQEGMAQVQADWDQTDSSQVSYIANKPNLSVYATTSAMNTALAGKQDNISDLADIRSGAAKGDTAVQPAALNDYATTAAMNTALACKQDVINDLSDIRSGASAGATAVQPSQLPSSDELVPSATSGDSGKVLTVNAQGEPGWVTPSAGTVYTAGDGIKIDNSEVSVDYDANTIDAVASQVTENVSTVVTGHHITDNIEDSQFEVPLEIQNWYNIYPAPTSTITMTIPANTFYYSGTISASAGQTVVVTAYNASYMLTTTCNLTSQPLTTTYDSAENKTWIDGQTVTFHYPLNPPEWSIQYGGKLKTIALGVFDYSTFTTIPFHTDSTTLANPIVFTYTSAAHQKIAVKTPLPASTSADENKVLTVNSSGNAVWQTVPAPSVDEVPAVTSSDDGKVLKASYSGGQGSYAWGTVSAGGGVSTVTVPDISYVDSVASVDSTLFTFNDFTVSVKGDSQSSMNVLLSHPTLTNAYVVSQYYGTNNGASVAYSDIKTYVIGARTTHPSVSNAYVYQPQDLTTPISLQTTYDTVSTTAGLPSHFDVEVMYSDGGSAKTFSFKLQIWSDIVEKTAWHTTYALRARAFISAA